MFGTLQALGSRSAFDFLLNSVYSKLIKLWGNKGFEVRIAGMRELPDWVNERIASLPEFKFLGFVDDLGSKVSKCHAVLAPISVPVGNRSRIVTAMAMGALVIAHENTTLGNPELISGENCLLAKTASEFARNMQVAYMDPEYSKEIGSAARITYLESFEPQPAAKRLIDLLESIKVQ